MEKKKRMRFFEKLKNTTRKSKIKKEVEYKIMDVSQTVQQRD